MDDFALGLYSYNPISDTSLSNHPLTSLSIPTLIPIHNNHQCIHHQLNSSFNKPSKNSKSPKSILIEFFQIRQKQLSWFTQTLNSNGHQSCFRCILKCPEIKLIGTQTIPEKLFVATGRSKKIAEREASNEALKYYEQYTLLSSRNIFGFNFLQNNEKKEQQFQTQMSNNVYIAGPITHSSNTTLNEIQNSEERMVKTLSLGQMSYDQLNDAQVINSSTSSSSMGRYSPSMPILSSQGNSNGNGNGNGSEEAPLPLSDEGKLILNESEYTNNNNNCDSVSEVKQFMLIMERIQDIDILKTKLKEYCDEIIELRKAINRMVQKIEIQNNTGKKIKKLIELFLNV